MDKIVMKMKTPFAFSWSAVKVDQNQVEELLNTFLDISAELGSLQKDYLTRLGFISDLVKKLSSASGRESQTQLLESLRTARASLAEFEQASLSPVIDLYTSGREELNKALGLFSQTFVITPQGTETAEKSKWGVNAFGVRT